MDYLTIKGRANFARGTELSAMVTSQAVESPRQRLPMEGPQESPELPISLIRPPSTAPQRLSTLPIQASGRLGLLNLAIRKSSSAMTLVSTSRRFSYACKLHESCSRIKLATVLTLTPSWPLALLIAIRCATSNVVMPTAATAPHSPMPR